MKDALTLFAPAKINLFLEVINRRKDGYHNIHTVMQKVNLFDTIKMSKAPSGVTVTSNNGLPKDEKNTVVKALNILRKRYNLSGGVKVSITKKIPIARGFGGGSSDAATAIIGANKLFRIGLTKSKMSKIAGVIGADVPFFLSGSLTLCIERGDKIKKEFAPKNLHYLILIPRFGNLTKKIYQKLSLPLTREMVKSSIFCKNLRNGSVEKLGKMLFNRLEEPAFKMKPELARIKRKMLEVGFCGVLMTGSGSAIYGLCKSGKEAMQKAKLLKKMQLGNVLVLSSLTT